MFTINKMPTLRKQNSELSSQFLIQKNCKKSRSTTEIHKQIKDYPKKTATLDRRNGIRDL